MLLRVPASEALTRVGGYYSKMAQSGKKVLIVGKRLNSLPCGLPYKATRVFSTLWLASPK